MKKLFIALVLITTVFTSKAQEASVEKSVFGIQTGLLGVWAYNEAKLSNQFALRTEIGLDAGIFASRSTSGAGFFLTPTITLEPRWYYNLDKRASKAKNISGNNGNFLSLKVNYNPDWFVISGENGLFVPNQISVIPTWGLRRSIGKHFEYETGFGIGYSHTFNKDNLVLKNNGEVAVNLHLRIGYRF